MNMQTLWRLTSSCQNMCILQKTVSVQQRYVVHQRAEIQTERQGGCVQERRPCTIYEGNIRCPKSDTWTKDWLYAQAWRLVPSERYPLSLVVCYWLQVEALRPWLYNSRKHQHVLRPLRSAKFNTCKPYRSACLTQLCYSFRPSPCRSTRWESLSSSREQLVHNAARRYS